MSNRAAFDKVDQCWNGAAPDFVLELARKCDDLGSQRAVAELIGYSAATVNLVLGNRYSGDMGRVETTIRGALMAETVPCPVLGEITKDICSQHQREIYRPTNSMRARLYRACRNCQYSQVGGKHG